MRLRGLSLGFSLLPISAIAQISSAQVKPNWDAIQANAARVLAEYVRVNTTNPPGNATNAAAFLRDILAREGIPATVWAPAPGKANLVARWKGNGRKRAVVLLNHMDVVPASPAYWTVDPFAGTNKDGYVWGRGTLDMKGTAVAQLMAIIALKREGRTLDRDVVFVATSMRRSAERSVLATWPETTSIWCRMPSLC